jgi:hypothetical protein
MVKDVEGSGHDHICLEEISKSTTKVYKSKNVCRPVLSNFEWPYCLRLNNYISIK